MINKIIKRNCKEVFPADVFQKGNSRVYLDDNGYYFTMIEFQPYSLKKGTFLNIGLSFLFDNASYLSFSYAYNNDVRVGRDFIEFKNEQQFENDIQEYIERANQYILDYRKFQDIDYAKNYMLKELDDSNWNPYIKSMFCFLAEDRVNGEKYYDLFLNDPFFKNIIARDNYPTELEKINKEYVLDQIRKQRSFWRTKQAMKKMKTFEEYS